MSTPNPDPEPRLRERPSERFSETAAWFDLHGQGEELAAEGSGQHGHAQKALFHHGPLTVATYRFDSGARLPDHRVDGTVVIQVVDGRLTVTTRDEVFDLPAGTLLRLAPNVPHDVEAAEDSQMLLTVCLEGHASGRSSTP